MYTMNNVSNVQVESPSAHLLIKGGASIQQTHTTKVHERHRVTPLGWDKQLTVHSVTTSLATHRRRLHVWCSVERQIDLIDSTHLSGCLDTFMHTIPGPI